MEGTCGENGEVGLVKKTAPGSKHLQGNGFGYSNKLIKGVMLSGTHCIYRCHL